MTPSKIYLKKSYFSHSLCPLNEHRSFPTTALTAFVIDPHQCFLWCRNKFFIILLEIRSLNCSNLFQSHLVKSQLTHTLFHLYTMLEYDIKASALPHKEYPCFAGCITCYLCHSNRLLTHIIKVFINSWLITSMAHIDTHKCMNLDSNK